jgi:nitroreductase
VEGSHFLVFASFEDLSAEYVDGYMDLIANTREIPRESLTPFADSVKGAMVGRPAEQNAAWAARQAYIGLGFGLVAAAMEQVDATPMEGFNPVLMDEILGLKEKGLKSVVVMALGYRDAEKDFLVNAKKVRLPHEEFFIEHK